MAGRMPKSWDELGVTLKELFNFKDYYTGKSIDFQQRQIRNAGLATEDYDYVVLKQLKDLVGGGISQPPAVQRGARTYDKITFGIGVGGSVTIGTNLTPPYIWSNSANGRPEILLAAANIPPVGDDLDFNITRNGTTIFPSSKFTIPNGTGAGVVLVTSLFNSVIFARRDVVQIGVSKIGTTTPGQLVTAVLFCKLL